VEGGRAQWVGGTRSDPAFLEALSRDIASDVQYARGEGRDDPAFIAAADLDALADELAARGLDARALDNDAIVAALEAQGGETLEQGAPVIRLSGREMTSKKNIEALRKAADDFFRRRLVGKVVERSDLGAIRISKRGREKTISTMASADKARLVPAIEAILRHGRLSNSRPAEGKDSRILRYHWITAPVELAGSVVDVGVMVEERRDGSLYYNINLDDARPEPDRGAEATNSGRTLRQSRSEDMGPDAGEINLSLTQGAEAAPRASVTFPAGGLDREEVERKWCTPNIVKSRYELRVEDLGRDHLIHLKCDGCGRMSMIAAPDIQARAPGYRRIVELMKRSFCLRCPRGTPASWSVCRAARGAGG
jgi:hypothetical protein